MALFGGRYRPTTTAAVVRPGELPEWLVSFLLHRNYPARGTPEALTLVDLMADPETAPHPGLLWRSPLRALWLKHRARLMTRWELEGHEREPWGTILDRDPDEDPRKFLHA